MVQIRGGPAAAAFGRIRVGSNDGGLAVQDVLGRRVGIVESQLATRDWPDHVRRRAVGPPDAKGLQEALHRRRHEPRGAPGVDLPNRDASWIRPRRRATRTRARRATRWIRATPTKTTTTTTTPTPTTSSTTTQLSPSEKKTTFAARRRRLCRRRPRRLVRVLLARERVTPTQRRRSQRRRVPPRLPAHAEEEPQAKRSVYLLVRARGEPGGEGDAYSVNAVEEREEGLDVCRQRRLI